MYDLMVFTLVPLFWLSIFFVYRYKWLKRKWLEVAVAEAVLALYEVDHEFEVYMEKGDFDARISRYPSLPKMTLMFWRWDWYAVRRLA